MLSILPDTPSQHIGVPIDPDLEKCVSISLERTPRGTRLNKARNVQDRTRPGKKVPLLDLARHDASRPINVVPFALESLGWLREAGWIPRPKARHVHPLLSKPVFYRYPRRRSRVAVTGPAARVDLHLWSDQSNRYRYVFISVFFCIAACSEKPGIAALIYCPNCYYAWCFMLYALCFDAWCMTCSHCRRTTRSHASPVNAPFRYPQLMRTRSGCRGLLLNEKKYSLMGIASTRIVALLRKVMHNGVVCVVWWLECCNSVSKTMIFFWLLMPRLPGTRSETPPRATCYRRVGTPHWTPENGRSRICREDEHSPETHACTACRHAQVHTIKTKPSDSNEQYLMPDYRLVQSLRKLARRRRIWCSDEIAATMISERVAIFWTGFALRCIQRLSIGA